MTVTTRSRPPVSRRAASSARRPATRGPRTSAPELPSAQRAVRCAIGLLFYIALLPLQWQEPAATGAGVLRYHHVGALLMIVIAWPPASAFRLVLRRLRPLPVAFVVLTIVSVATALTWGGRPVNYVQTFVYAVIGVISAAALLTALQTERSRRILAWTGPVTLATFIVFYYIAARQAGIEPVSTLLNGIQAADPVRLQTQLFTVVFRAENELARANTRHEVMAALVVAGAIGIGAAAAARKSPRLANLAMLGIVLICAISLSRSIMLALALVLVPVLIRLISNGNLGPAQFYGLFVAAFAVPALVAFGASLLLARFTDTRSYDARLGAFDLPSHELIDRVLVGGTQLPDSTHTLMFDALLEGSIIAFLASLVMVVVLCALMVRAGGLYLRTGSALPLAIVMALAVPIVRAFTAGGGQIAGPGWLAMAFAAAAFVHLESGAQASEALDHDPTDDEPPSVAARRRTRGRR